FGHASVLLHEGRELDVVNQADGIDHFPAIRGDLDRVTRASAVCEVVEQLAQEREPDVRLYRMVVGALRALEAQPAPLLVPAFHLKALAAEGIAPELDVCVSCGSEGPLVAFDVEAGGALCRDCRRGMPMSAAALALMRRILGGELNAVLAEPASATGHEGEHLPTRAMEPHPRRRAQGAACPGGAGWEAGPPL